MTEPAIPSASVCTFLLLAWLLTGHSGAVKITSAGPQTVHVAEGDDIQIQCVFKLEPSDEGELDIEWSIINPDTTKPDPVILTYVHSQIFEYPSVFSGRFSFTEQNPSQGNASVRVRSLHLRDTNSFQCKVKKAPGIDTRKVTVKVHVQPQAPRCWADRSGEEVRLQCHSEAGSPPLTYSWEKVSGTRQGLPQNSVTDSGSGTLLIRNGTDPSLFGTYRCLVRNLVGMEDCQLTLAAPAERREAGVIVAAVLAAILALLLLLLLVLCCCCRKRHQKERPHDIREDATPPLSSAPSVRSVKSYKAHQTRKSERMEGFRTFVTMLRQAVTSTLKGCQGPECEGGGGGTVPRSSVYPYTNLLKGQILFIILIFFSKLAATADEEVIGLLGQSITLPCHMEGGESEGLKVYWQNRQTQQADGQDLMVWIYKDGRVQMQKVHQYFYGRAHVPVPGIASGNLSLSLQQLQANDSGYYQCVIIRRGQTTDTQLYKLTVRDVETSGRNHYLIFIVLTSIAVIVIFCCWRSKNYNWCGQLEGNSEFPRQQW
ncbi:coxsackievirus and adenovirus receptor homolog isoform X2 [Hypanus sabinus]|uniref:coxsackievirus and adenovirus receptor homolog isoform X2 n=1 Tax=Hypanus sabinus TaxID=79690 RepID=UPI0028C4B84A|nr:coxsackievirus and adenovirus receptor homolog isoform X2 [Hypanus sabinus]